MIQNGSPIEGGKRYEHEVGTFVVGRNRLKEIHELPMHGVARLVRNRQHPVGATSSWLPKYSGRHFALGKAQRKARAIPDGTGADL